MSLNKDTIKELRENWVIYTSLLLVYSLVVAGIYNLTFWQPLGVDFLSYVDGLFDIYKYAVFSVIAWGTFFSLTATYVISVLRDFAKETGIKFSTSIWFVIIVGTIIFGTTVATIEYRVLKIASDSWSMITVFGTIYVIVTVALLTLHFSEFVKSIFNTGIKKTFYFILFIWPISAFLAGYDRRERLMTGFNSDKLDTIVLNDKAVNLIKYNCPAGIIGNNYFIFGDSFKSYCVINRDEIVFISFKK